MNISTELCTTASKPELCNRNHNDGCESLSPLIRITLNLLFLDFQFMFISKKEINAYLLYHLFVIVCSTSDCYPRGPAFDSRLYPRNVSEV